MMTETESNFSTPSEQRNGNSSVLKKCVAWAPPPWLEKVVIGSVTPILVWMVLFLLVGQDGLPGGQIFALLVLLFAGVAAGYLVELIKFPPLLGMLAVGIVIRNVPGIRFGQDLDREVSSALRQIALVVILIRAGLGLDPTALRKLSTVVIRLAFGPCLVEATILAITSYFILGFPLAWGFLLGFVLAAVSPAVTVPCLLNLRDRGYGVAKGIPTIVIAAASVDDILAISAFGVTLGFAISQEESLAMMIAQGPIELVLGITFGVLWGLGLGAFIGQSDKGNREATVLRLVFTLAGGCLAVFGFQYIKFPGSGALGCLVSAFIAAIVWRNKGVLEDNDDLNWAFQTLWFIFQPLLFGLIGCEIDLTNLDPSVVLFGLLCLCISLVFRILTSFYMVAGAGLTIKERLFIAMAWLPKATVQAAIGPVAYDLARNLKAGEAAEKLGLEVLTIAVLSILLTAPVGAIAIMVGGPRLLTKDSASGEEGEKALAFESKTKESTFDSLPQEGQTESQERMVGKSESNDMLLKMISETASAPKRDGADIA